MRRRRHFLGLSLCDRRADADARANGRIDKLSGGKCKSDDFEAVKARMATFMAAGFRDICKRRNKK